MATIRKRHSRYQAQVRVRLVSHGRQVFQRGRKRVHGQLA